MAKKRNKKSKKESFPQRLKRARAMENWKQNELSYHAGINPSIIAHFEMGSRKPSFENLKRISKALNVTSDYLLGLSNNPKPTSPSIPLVSSINKLTSKDASLVKSFIRILNNRKKKA